MSPAINKCPSKCENLYSKIEMLMTLDGPTVIDANARYWSRFVPQLEYCHNVWYGKIRMVSLPDGEKN